MLVLVAVPSAGARDWLRFGGDNQLTNAVAPADAGGIDAADVSHLGVRWQARLDGALVASPLFVSSVAVNGQDEGVVYAATENGSVYALRADDGTVLWQRQLGAVSVLACGQSFGISSTGVADPILGRLYVIGASGLLYALDLASGATVPGWPLQLIADTSREYVWGGLTLANGRLYVPVASYCDAPGADGIFAEGRLVAVDPVLAQVIASWDVVLQPNSLGGIWGFGGSSVDPAGDLWTATGNSWVYDAGCDCILETADYGESVVELDPALNVLAADRPPGIPTPVTDTDFGSTPLLFQPPDCPPLAAAHSKNGFAYVWDRDDLAAGPIWSAHIGPDDLATPFIGEPSYSPTLNMLFIANARVYGPDGQPTHFDAAVSFAIGPGCTIAQTPTWIADAGEGTKPPPLIVNDVVFIAGGDFGALIALDANTGATLLTATLDGLAYSPPAFAGNKVLIGTAAGTLFAFGEPPPVVQVPADRLYTAPASAKRVRVTYKTTALDSTGPVPVSCRPASGSRFKIGKTTVVCTATSNENTTTATFTVTVRASHQRKQAARLR